MKQDEPECMACGRRPSDGKLVTLGETSPFDEVCEECLGDFECEVDNFIMEWKRRRHLEQERL